MRPSYQCIFLLAFASPYLAVSQVSTSVQSHNAEFTEMNNRQGLKSVSSQETNLRGARNLAESEASTFGKRRKFVSYESSPWEKYWLNNTDNLHDNNKICSVLLKDQINQLRDYLEVLCTRYFRPHDDWCIIDDAFFPLWFNIGNKETLDLTFENPLPLIVQAPPVEPVSPNNQYEHILSKFTYFDEIKNETYHEYIEPLVGHLRFPLHKCLHPVPIIPQYRNHYTSFRGWILPPPPVVRGDRALLFDSSASSWESKSGGLSAQFISEIWLRHGVGIDEVWAFDDNTTPSEFFQGVPGSMMGVTHFKHGALADGLDTSKEKAFLPLFIREHATENDYVILKLDTKLVGILDHLTHMHPEYNQVDEIVWEHKSETMFLFENDLPNNLTIQQIYEMFLKLRQKGIRAHAWM
mmetsp:Transcript_13690/g.20184  ORF Transcript_13690/g.20184 Transcript_13690/m.20184 type:complete len:409 (-) Transcript_13690:342-1568(-)